MFPQNNKRRSGLTPPVPRTEVRRGEARHRGDEELGGLLLPAGLPLGPHRGPRRPDGGGQRVEAVLLLGGQLRREAQGAGAAAEVGRAAAAQGVELPQLVAQQVAQRGAAHRAAEAGQQQVASGAEGGGRQAEGLGVLGAGADAAAAAAALGLHNGRQLVVAGDA